MPFRHSVRFGAFRGLPLRRAAHGGRKGRLLIALGLLILLLWFGKRKEIRRFRFVWLYVALSFLFYILLFIYRNIIKSILFVVYL